MFADFLRSAMRSLVRRTQFTVINLVGLAIGLAACILIVAFVQHEFSYDTFFSDTDRLFRIEATASIPGQDPNESPNFFGAARDLLPPDFEEIEQVVRLQQREGTVITGDTSIAETFATVDPEFLTVFDFPMVEGDRATALSEPTAVVITRAMAEKHLGPAPWTGRTLRINETFERDLKVTGVIETLPGNTHFDIDFLVPVNRAVYDASGSMGTTDLERWNGLPFNVYVKLKSGRSAETFAANLPGWVDRHFPSQIRALVEIDGSELFRPRLTPVRDIHLWSPVTFDMRPHGNLTTILGYGAIALLMLVIACVNFVNLSTATSTLRAREVALRKVVGAKRRQLFLQFELESVIYALLALLLAVGIVYLVLPAFGSFTQRDIAASGLLNWTTVSVMLALTLLVGLLAGLHPALVLSGMRPSRILQGSSGQTTGGTRLRAALVLFQFAISAGLIITSLLIYLQTQHARTMDLGYDNDHVLAVRGLSPQQIGDGLSETVRDEVARIPGVSRVSLASFSPGDGLNTGLSLKVPGQSERLVIFYRGVYPPFFPQFGVTPLAGRLLDDAHPGDRTVFIDDPDSLETQQANVVVNELAAQRLGFATAEEAIGKVYYRGRENQIVSTIVGVVPNVHFGSPRSNLDAEIYMYVPAEVNTLLVSYRPGRFAEVRSAIESTLTTLLPRALTSVQHLEDNVAEQYREEAIQSTLLAQFAGLAILVACMGLFGLSSFTISRRTREIGMRKVMGATSRQIVLLLLRQFSRPVLVANVLAWPVCWYLISRWLESFNNRIELTPWFAATAAAALFATTMLAWLTVAGHAIRVARSKPVSALRYQ